MRLEEGHFKNMYHMAIEQNHSGKKRLFKSNDGMQIVHMQPVSTSVKLN